MPKDALYEESAQCANGARESKYFMVFHIAGWIFLVIAGIGLAIFLSTILPYTIGDYRAGTITSMGLILTIVLWAGSAGMFALGAFLFFRLRLRFNVSYDYLFVEDELRITKVFNGKKRKHIITMAADHVLQVGYCVGDSFERTYQGLNGAKPRVMTANKEPAEGKEFIHILYSSPIGKELYILECRKEMLEYVVRAAGRNKFVKE